jgi:hypothetical protein
LHRGCWRACRRRCEGRRLARRHRLIGWLRSDKRIATLLARLADESEGHGAIEDLLGRRNPLPVPPHRGRLSQAVLVAIGRKLILASDLPFWKCLLSSYKNYKNDTCSDSLERCLP